MIYEIINPSDMVTIESDNLIPAGIACWMLSSGYGLHDENGDTVWPIVIFGGQDEWLIDHDITDLGEYIKENAIEIANILESAMYVSIGERKSIKLAMEKMSEDKSREYLRELNEIKRTSMNNIGEVCLSLADRLKKININAT